jgi:hypothetical protein
MSPLALPAGLGMTIAKPPRDGDPIVAVNRRIA